MSGADYSCGCMDYGFKRPKEPWEASDGAVYLLAGQKCTHTSTLLRALPCSRVVHVQLLSGEAANDLEMGRPGRGSARRSAPLVASAGRHCEAGPLRAGAQPADHHLAPAA